jgi:hypothetical protein
MSSPAAPSTLPTATPRQLPFARVASLPSAALLLGAGGGFVLASVLTLTRALRVPAGPWWPVLAQAHGHLQVYGWAGLFVLGCGAALSAAAAGRAAGPPGADSLAARRHRRWTAAACALPAADCGAGRRPLACGAGGQRAARMPGHVAGAGDAGRDRPARRATGGSPRAVGRAAVHGMLAGHTRPSRRRQPDRHSAGRRRAHRGCATGAGRPQRDAGPAGLSGADGAGDVGARAADVRGAGRPSQTDNLASGIRLFCWAGAGGARCAGRRGAGHLVRCGAWTGPDADGHGTGRLRRHLHTADARAAGCRRASRSLPLRPRPPRNAIAHR